MAELLIKAVDTTNRDPTKDRAGCYKRGDVVIIFEDGHEYGREEKPPNFVIVKIPGLSAKDERITRYLDAEYRNGRLTDDGKVASCTARRAYRVLLDNLVVDVQKPVVVSDVKDIQRLTMIKATGLREK